MNFLLQHQYIILMMFPHIGRAYTTISCDILARFNKLLENDVFLTGTDEHGQKVEKGCKRS